MLAMDNPGFPQENDLSMLQFAEIPYLCELIGNSTDNMQARPLGSIICDDLKLAGEVRVEVGQGHSLCSQGVGCLDPGGG